MSRKTFKQRAMNLEEAAWIVKNEAGELKAMYEELEAEVVRLTEEVRVLRLANARYKNQLQTVSAHA